MGLLGSLWNAAKGQMANVVEWPDMEEEDIFTKWPNAELKKGSKLIIRPGQDAIFFYQGRVEGIFTEEGEYDIDSQIIPFLSTLKGFKYGFDSGLRAEVLFVNTREFMIPWGTQNAINLPVQGLPGGMPIRAFGQMICKVGDYNLLVEKVAGVTAGYQVSDIRPRVSAVNDQLLMKWIVREGKDMFNIQANAYDIGKGIASLAAQVPALHDSRDLVHPGHCHGIARDIHEYQLLPGACQGLDKGILPVRQAIFQAVRTLTILILVLIQTAEDYHIVGILRSSYSVLHHLLRGT